MFTISTPRIFRTNYSLNVYLNPKRLASSKITTPGAPRRKDTSGFSDKRYQLIKDILYKPPLKTPQIAKLNTTDLERREIIERVWSLLKSRESQEQEISLLKKYRSMRAALEELKETDERLFRGTGVMESHAADSENSDDNTLKEPILFPRRLKIPTETPPIGGWDANNLQ